MATLGLGEFGQIRVVARMEKSIFNIWVTVGPNTMGGLDSVTNIMRLRFTVC